MRIFRSTLFWTAGVLLCTSGYPYNEKKPFHPSFSALLGVPHPLNIAADMAMGRYFSAGVCGGTISYTYRGGSDPVELKLPNYEGRFRIHPFGGAFFLGTIFGWHSLSASASKNITASSISVPTTLIIRLKTFYATPHLGWMWVYKSGFTWGMELGIQLPISPETDVEITTSEAFNSLLEIVKTTQEYKTLEKDVQDLGKQIAKTALPFITLLRLGWTF